MYIRSLLRFILQALSPAYDYADRERKTLEKDTERPVIEVAIYQSTDLAKTRGRTPERTLGPYIAQALDEAGFDYKIDYGFTQTYDSPYPVNSSDHLDWWAKRSPELAANSNILLYDARGGGRAGLGGPNAIVGMNRVRFLDEDPEKECDSTQCSNLWAGIHELGHNLGGRHSTPMMEDKPSMLFHPNMVEHLQTEYGDQ